MTSSPTTCTNSYCRDGWIERGDNESGAAPAMPCRVCSPTDPLPSACRCLLSEHCDRTRPGCRLKAGATINQGGGICGPYEMRSDPLPSDLDEQRRKRFTRRQIEDHLARELVHWLPGEGGGNPEQRASAAQAAAKIITERLR